MKTFFTKARAWIVRDWKRFVWEVAIAVFLSTVSWGVTHLLNQKSNQVCQDEAEAMKKEWLLQQAAMDKLAYERVIAEKEFEISQKEQDINDLREKMASDSIKRMSDLDAVRAINTYIKAGRGRLYKPG